MAPSQPAVVNEDRRGRRHIPTDMQHPTPDSPASTTRDRRPSAGSGYFSNVYSRASPDPRSPPMVHPNHFNIPTPPTPPNIVNNSNSSYNSSYNSNNNSNKVDDRPRVFMKDRSTSGNGSIGNGNNPYQQQQQQQHQQAYYNHLDALAQTPAMPQRRKNNNVSKENNSKDGRDGSHEHNSSSSSGILSFFRGNSSRPPSPSPDSAAVSVATSSDTYSYLHSNSFTSPQSSHTRKTSFTSQSSGHSGANSGSNIVNGFVNSFSSANNNNNNSNNNNNNNNNYNNNTNYSTSNNININNSNANNRNARVLNGSVGPLLSANSSSSLNSHHNLPPQPIPGIHVRQHSQGMDTERRRSIDSISRSSSPDLGFDSSTFQQQQQGSSSSFSRQQSFPTTPPAPNRQHQRTDSNRNGNEPQLYGRTRSNDYLDAQLQPRRPQDESQHHPIASPAKESKPKKTIFSLFKKAHLGHHASSSSSSSSQQNQQGHPQSDRPRKPSADDHYALLQQSNSVPYALPLALFPDQDNTSPSYNDRRNNSDASDTQRALQQHVTGSKKNAKNGVYNVEFNGTLVRTFLVDIKDITNVNKDGMSNNWLPPGGSSGSEAWLAPESWGVLPPTSILGGSAQRSQALTPEDASSEDLDLSDFEWDYTKKKSPTIRIFRPDTTYTTMNCVLTTTASELAAALGKKIFKPDTSKYHIYILRNNIVRQLRPNEKPLNILRKCLIQFGYTDEDRLEDLCGKDNSFLCRFTFEENGAPLTTEADIRDHANYADVNLQRRGLPTIPIFLYSKAKDIVRLNVSHNQRMDLPLDFVQNCSVLRELRMAHNDLGRVPSNIRSIVYLQVLDLRGNRIKDLEKAHLEEARELMSLHLQCNRLESLPEDFQTFEHLRCLNLSGNNFSKVPLVLFKIASLEELDLSFNEISELPEEIGQLSRLRKLLLFGNRIGPYLPSTIGRLSHLRQLDLRQNGILNLDAVCSLPALQDLLVDYNNNVILSGAFQSLTKLSLVKCSMTNISLTNTGETLTSLDLSSNKLSSLSPSLFEHLLNLEVLLLDGNGITSIPGTIGALKKLKVLMMANNSLSSLPDEIGSLESLITLDIHSNHLAELPVAIWRLSLISLNASSNLLDTFPDPPKVAPNPPNNNGPISNSSSAVTLCDVDGSGLQKSSPSPNSPSPSLSRPKPLPPPPVQLQSMPSNRGPYTPPLALSLHSLCLSDNRLPDEVMYPLSSFVNLQILNLSHNYIGEIPRGKIPNVGHLVELYLGGNQLTSLPAEDIERLRNLRVLHVNGNKLTTLPAELGKINRLVVLDVGCNKLKYNISNWPYDWNWNWNLELKYLNMSGNERLQIKRPTIENASVTHRQGNLSEFGNLIHLRCLGLMDVTITDNVPENSVDRRVRTSMSTLHNMSYGMADTLGVGENLCIWDLVHPKFQTKEDESLFGLFDGRNDRYRSNSTMISHLKDRFGTCLKLELEKMEGEDTVVSALRRTFLGLDRELFSLAREDEGRGGASALVAYIKGTTLYSANVGDAIAVLVKKSDSYQVVSQKHIPWNPQEASRIKRSGGFVSENGLLNDELDISRSFGQYHLVPVVNPSPCIETTTLTEDDDFLIMASSAFWDVMSYSTAVEIAKAGNRTSGDLMYASQRLRDIAISYGAKEHMVVMLIGVGDLFKKKEPVQLPDYHQYKMKRPKPAEAPLDSLRHLKPEIEPPQGDVAMVFTDIKNSTKLWESIPEAMQVAIKKHFDIMRRQLRSIGGYEVKNEGDALMASFSSVPAAMLWCFKVQELLVNAEWPRDILNSEECKAIFNESDPNQPMYRGLSVRMGIHWGRPVSDRDAVTRRMDYYGPMVNRAGRICDCADGGEICVSSDVINVMQHLLSDPDLEQSDSIHAEPIRELKKMGFGVIELGERKLKGLETPENLHLIYSRSLAGRLSMDPSKGLAGTPILET
ncbi:cysteinyl-tRNA synthetase, partial [Podila epigama]